MRVKDCLLGWLWLQAHWSQRDEFGVLKALLLDYKRLSMKTSVFDGDWVSLQEVCRLHRPLYLYYVGNKVDTHARLDGLHIGIAAPYIMSKDLIVPIMIPSELHHA